MFTLLWTPRAQETYDELKAKASASLKARRRSRKKKATKAEGVFKQVHKCVTHLTANPKHPGLHTHEYHSLTNPHDPKQKVFEAYAQHKTPGAYRVFWCYGKKNGEITIIAITPHP